MRSSIARHCRPWSENGESSTGHSKGSGSPFAFDLRSPKQLLWATPAVGYSFIQARFECEKSDRQGHRFVFVRRGK